MSTTVCLCAKTLHYLNGGGHFWVYLNWALGLRANGCRVIWLEAITPTATEPDVLARVAALKQTLEPYALAESVALCSWSGEPLPDELTEGCLDLAAAAEADLLLNLAYGIPAAVVGRFRRRALIDIDPGLLQTWMHRAQVYVAPHDLYFSTGETVGQPGARFPDCGLRWLHTTPCVALDYWPARGAPDQAPFTTVTHWHAGEWVEEAGEVYLNDKRSGFLPFLDLPKRVKQPLELALCLAPEDEEEWAMLRRCGWAVRHAWEVSSDPQSYQKYVQESRGEFSCVKPSCVRFQNAWISDRTICYLASGKPAIVQHTGPSRILPHGDGLFRFADLDEAVRCLELVTADYERHSRSARALAEEHFGARGVVGRVLEQALS